MLAAVTRRLGCTEGQLYTLVTGAVLAVVLMTSGIAAPAVDPFRGFAAAPAVGTRPTASPTTPTMPAADAPAPALPDVYAAPAMSYAVGDASGSDTSVLADGPSAASSPGPVGPTTFAVVGPPGAPGGLAVTPDGRVFVTTDNGTARGIAGPSHLFGFTPTGSSASDATVSGQPANHADGLTGVAVGRDGHVVVLDASSNRILDVDPQRGTQSVIATIPDVKPCLLGLAASPCEPGVTDNRPALAAAAFDATGALFVSDAGQATIWRLAPAATKADPWYQSQDLATGDGPAGLAFDADGSLLFTVGTTVDPSNVRGGGLYRLARNSNGSAGSRTLVAPFAADDRPGALAVSTSGVAYVVVRKTGTIVAVDHGTTKPVPTDGLTVPLDAPSALAVAGDRLLVANQSASNDAARWAVLSLPI